ncbi:MAG: hypothetical protein KBD19_04790 [Candidatus Moranbacteria bacterium]|nr:hypothetical protein [Candidatus Moranbacteria bacterium]
MKEHIVKPSVALKGFILRMFGIRIVDFVPGVEKAINGLTDVAEYTFAFPGLATRRAFDAVLDYLRLNGIPFSIEPDWSIALDPDLPVPLHFSPILVFERRRRLTLYVPISGRFVSEFWDRMAIDLRDRLRG